MERAEYASTFRGGSSTFSGRIATLVGVCTNVIGAHPDIILQQAELWDILPDHLKEYIRTATRLHRASEVQPVLLEKMFIEDSMEILNLDNFPGVTNAFLRTVHDRLDLEKLTFLSLVNNTQVKGSAVASFLRGCVNIKHINFKGCINLNNDAFPEKLVKKLTHLSYVNVSFTQVGGKALASIYSHCPKLATFKMAGCKFIDGNNIAKIISHPSQVLISLKLRHCSINQQQLQYILEQLPNLQVLDCSSSSASTFRSIRPFLNISHPSQLRKLNLSNCPNLELTKHFDLIKLFSKHQKLEHIYMTDAKVHARLAIPEPSLANLKTIFFPGILYPTDFLPAVLEIAQNLTYLDLSHTDLRFERSAHRDPLIFNVPHLQTLSLEDTRVSDESAELISQIHTLRALFLRGTAISAIGVRVIVYACPWLEEIDLASCRRIDIRDRRTLIHTLRQEFLESLGEALAAGKVLDNDTSDWYVVQRFQNDEEEKDGLVKMDIEQ